MFYPISLKCGRKKSVNIYKKKTGTSNQIICCESEVKASTESSVAKDTVIVVIRRRLVT